MKHVTHRITAIFLVLLLCFALAGCGSKEPYLPVLDLVKRTMLGDANALSQLLTPEYKTIMEANGITAESYTADLAARNADNPVTEVSYTVNSSEKITDMDLSTVNSRRNMYSKDNTVVTPASEGYRIDTTFTVTHTDGQKNPKYLVLYIICVDGNWYLDPLSLGA